MKSLVIVAGAHLAGIVILGCVAYVFNDAIKAQTAAYEGFTAVFSVAFGIYSFALNLLYHKSQEVYLWVNRLLLMVRRTHTYWLPAFSFSIPGATLEDRQTLVERVEDALETLPHKKIKRISQTPSSATISIDDALFVVLRINDGHFFVTLDRKILVPSHLYELYCQRLARIGEAIRDVVKPDSVRLGISITFDDGVANPYYGFFVQRVPPQLLRHFEASFTFGHGSSCRIEAATDGISIEGTSLTDFFLAISKVLALRTAPGQS